MANYDRRILVPYLQDVCSMEMMCAKLERIISNTKREIVHLDSHINLHIHIPHKPQKNHYEAEYRDPIIFLILFGIIPLVLTIRGLLRNSGWLGLLIGFAIACYGFYVGVGGILDESKKTNELYQNDLNSYNERINAQIKHQNLIPSLRENLQKKQDFLHTTIRELNTAKILLRDLYDINIIPSRYRNIHVAYYLYDFFNTSRETDLEKVLQTMLLDEIIQRLDKIVAQNEEILLNQRASIALQERNNQMLAENHRQQLERIAQMERNQELQLDYQRMIAKNQIITNYFLEAEYIRNR